MAAFSVEMQRDLSSGSSCSSGRIAPHAHSSLYLPSEKECPASTSSISQTQTRSRPKTVLDDVTKTRLIQLYTTCQPITCPKKIQSQFTCLYLTKSNIKHILYSLSNYRQKSQNQHPRLSSHPRNYSHFTDLSKLTEQSWRVTAGTLDYLELIWTGQEQDKSWADALDTQTSDDDHTTTSTSSSSEADEDKRLALNMAVTYYYTPDGQPTLSLAAIAMTKEAFDAINSHIVQQSCEIPCCQPVDFDTIPFVHRSLLVPTLCRWRNADVQSSLTMAAEGRAWATKLLSEDWGEEMELDVPGAWFFPTAKTVHHNLNECLQTADTSPFVDEDEMGLTDTSVPNSPSTSATQTFAKSLPTSEAAFGDESLDLQSSHKSHDQKDPSSTHELRAALIPGRDAVFRTIASRLSVLLDRQWIRRSTQFPVDHSTLAFRSKSRSSGTKRRRGA